MHYIVKIVKSLEALECLLIKIVSKGIKKEVKEQKGRFLRILLNTFGNPWTGKSTIKTGEFTIRAVEVIFRAGQNL